MAPLIKASKSAVSRSTKVGAVAACDLTRNRKDSCIRLLVAEFTRDGAATDNFIKSCAPEFHPLLLGISVGDDQTGYYFLIARTTTVLGVPIDAPTDSRVLEASTGMDQDTPDPQGAPARKILHTVSSTGEDRRRLFDRVVLRGRAPRSREMMTGSRSSRARA